MLDAGNRPLCAVVNGPGRRRFLDLDFDRRNAWQRGDRPLDLLRDLMNELRFAVDATIKTVTPACATSISLIIPTKRYRA